MTVKNLSSAVNAYRYNAEPAERKKSTAKRTSGGRNVDKFDFSGAENTRASFTDALRAAAKSAAESSASPERLRALNTAVRNGSYNVSDEAIADSILGR
ncbi:MAG: flagellar biosynthesis anti-sigma factor FlgM [Ruminococcus sp.]|nr:flagellar biosynthesis anti-sigma factor FlgM [Ruminococcus sp.]